MIRLSGAAFRYSPPEAREALGSLDVAFGRPRSHGVIKEPGCDTFKQNNEKSFKNIMLTLMYSLQT